MDQIKWREWLVLCVVGVGSVPLLGSPTTAQIPAIDRRPLLPTDRRPRSTTPLAPIRRMNLAVLVSFNGNNGAVPQAELLRDTQGNFYGTTFQGGRSKDCAAGCGTIFRLAATGRFRTLVNFNGLNGRQPDSPLILGEDGNLYGTTTGGGRQDYGTVFRLTPSGNLRTLASFTGVNGAAPRGRLLQGRDGNFYGTTETGGKNNLGTIYRLTPAGNLRVLVHFNRKNGANPQGGLTQDEAGNIYGTTARGGRADAGTVFRLTSGADVRTLTSFNGRNGANPQGELVRDRLGNFYGVTENGGQGGQGTVFRLSLLGGSVRTLVHFNGNNGAFPQAGLIRSRDGSFFGTTAAGGTSGQGVTFRITPSGQFRRLFSFSATRGGRPQGSLIQGGDPIYFFGTTTTAGRGGQGTLFRLTLSSR